MFRRVSRVGVGACLECSRLRFSTRLLRISLLGWEPGSEPGPNLQNPDLPVQVQVRVNAEPGPVVRVRVLVKTVNSVNRIQPTRKFTMR
jgi:hypothetical protein